MESTGVWHVLVAQKHLIALGACLDEGVRSSANVDAKVL